MRFNAEIFLIMTKEQPGQTDLKPIKKDLELTITKPDPTLTQTTDDEENKLMSEILSKTKATPTLGAMVEGTIIAIDKAAVFIDLSPFSTGLIFGREYNTVRDVFKNANIGDVIIAKVVEIENEDGYIELSLKEARQALVWSEAGAALNNKTILELPVKEANKGGLIIEWQGIQGFLPASQLKAEHYPRVTDGNKDKILDELRKLIGQSLPVAIIGALPKEGKLIFSEKNIGQKEKTKMVGKYAVGDELEGEVTSAVDFGVFIKIEDELEGLVHISEISWSLVKDPRALFKTGEKIKVKIIEIENGKISLSIKALTDNPWKTAAKKYKKGDEVEGVIIKFNKHGALASVEEGIAGLIHVSEFENEEKLREALELGKNYKFKINIFEPNAQKMILAFVS